MYPYTRTIHIYDIFTIIIHVCIVLYIQVHINNTYEIINVEEKYNLSCIVTSYDLYNYIVHTKIFMYHVKLCNMAGDVCMYGVIDLFGGRGTGEKGSGKFWEGGRGIDSGSDALEGTKKHIHTYVRRYVHCTYNTGSIR